MLSSTATGSLGSTLPLDYGDAEMDTKELISTITAAVQEAMLGTRRQGSAPSSDDLLQLGLGIGLGIGMRKQQSGDTIRTAHSSDTIRTAHSGDGANLSAETPGIAADSSLIVATPRHKGLAEPSPTPDEVRDPMVVADTALHPTPANEFERHAPAGEGKYWSVTGSKVAKSKGVLQKSKAALPEGFMSSIFTAHTASQHADYLPVEANLNEATSVGVVKPRHILEDWKDSGFDPWSSGKDPLATSFVPSLFIDEETGEDKDPGHFKDAEGLQAMDMERQLQEKLKKELDMVFSWCRHGKYGDIESFFNDPDVCLSIDAKDAGGNTLLHVCAQNGNKRITKLCLRRGADINNQNLNGNAPLHYAFAYGFEDVAQYLMDKGADDALLNADGLTCYEGLNMDDVNNL